MYTRMANQWNAPYNVYNPVAEKRRDMENDAAIYKRWRKEQDQKKSEKSIIKTKIKTILPRSLNQDKYINSIYNNPLTFGIGPAGTGKTYLAVAAAAYFLEAGLVDRIILSRPAVEAGEKLGFLPGDLKEKIDPYLRPLYDALYDCLPANKVIQCII